MVNKYKPIYYNIESKIMWIMGGFAYCHNEKYGDDIIEAKGTMKPGDIIKIPKRSHELKTKENNKHDN